MRRIIIFVFLGNINELLSGFFFTIFVLITNIISSSDHQIKVIITGVTATPKFHVHTTVYDYKFRISDNPKFPYSSIDVNPKFGRVVFLIVGANDYTEITKSKSNIKRTNFSIAFF